MFNFDLKMDAIFVWISIWCWLRRVDALLFSSLAVLVNLIQYRASMGVFDNRDNDLKHKYLNYSTILSVIHVFNFPKLFNFILFPLFQTTVSGSFAILYFFHETY